MLFGTPASLRRRSGSIMRMWPRSSAVRLPWLGSSNIDEAAVVAWANESSAIAERPDVQYCVQVADSCSYAWDQPEYKGGAQRVVIVDDPYLTAQAATVLKRLKMAGIRLAAILNTALTTS